MRKISYLLMMATAVSFASCKESWKKADEGMEYKIIADGKGDKIKTGEFLEFQFTSVWNDGKKDSVLNDTRVNGGPQIIPFDSASLPPAYFKIFKELKKGDSLTTKMITDSIFKKQPEAMPPFMKKGQYVYTNLRVTNIYKTKEEAEKARIAAMAANEAAGKIKAEGQAKTDDKTLNDFFAKNNIKTVKTANGSYVEIIQPGTGPMIDTTVVAKINYTGRLTNGKMFDSNTDPSKGHLEPLTVNMTSNPGLGGGVIPGMTEALKMLNKGAKAKLYIPSGQGYGAQAGGPELPANSNLVFEVEVLDILNKTQAAAAMAAAQKKMMEMQKRYSDSMAKVAPQQGNPNGNMQQVPPPQNP
jgi:FKBP-type peptidyl-prolyl cis-trans isomerase FkpA